jgi:hypothetical protein
MRIGDVQLERPRERWITASAIALAVASFIASAVSLAVRTGGAYYPWADRALLELRVRDIGSHAELLGPYSRFHWFHPGPLLFYLLAPIYRLTGSNAISLGIGALAINAACVVGILVIARRRGGVPLLLLTLLLVEVLLLGLGSQFVRDDWNPYVTVLPFLLLVFVCWSLACGDSWALPVGAGIATFMVQSHVGYAALAAALVAAGLIGYVQTRPTGWRRPLLWTSGVLILLWFPVALDQLTNEPGNLDQLFRFFREVGTGESWPRAWKVITMQLGSRPDWVFGETSLRTFIERLYSAPAFPYLLLFLLAGTWFAWRRARDAFRLDCIVLGGLAAGVFAVTRIVAGLFPYLVRWTWPLGMMVVLAAAWSALAGWRRVPRWLLAVFAAGAVVLASVNVVAAAGAGNPNAEFSARIGPLSHAVRRAVPPGKGVVEIKGAGDQTFVLGTGAGVANELERAGIPIRVSPSLAYAFGNYRKIGNEHVRATVLVSRSRTAPTGYRFLGEGVGAGVYIKPG